eukprot:CAMPEP_0198697508 /NCGR_PEP_ID=MMETSP1468-20131203/323843_1 /TAXON_ID=1461545 /ORGANISM="Mantoniella sp, Strain CCMP1436" /LENGTH=92 /DNA_ID=CAMNT_0044454209 /DNA_START=231 /DNA_END=505 /DNA_ORIENTATION=+
MADARRSPLTDDARVQRAALGGSGLERKCLSTFDFQVRILNERLDIVGEMRVSVQKPLDVGTRAKFVAAGAVIIDVGFHGHGYARLDLSPPT